MTREAGSQAGLKLAGTIASLTSDCVLRAPRAHRATSTASSR